MRGNILIVLLLLLWGAAGRAQQSAAREWNELLLFAIENDFARPTVHARNLFHVSAAMYDAWAVYDSLADTYLLGKTVHDFHCRLEQFPMPADRRRAQEEAISFAAYRLIQHRFQRAPGREDIYTLINRRMRDKGYDRFNTSADYRCGPAEMGNYIAQCYIRYGLQDGANESEGYADTHYKPVNPPLEVADSLFPANTDLNRWQPLQLREIVDQSGNPLAGNVQSALTHEWGRVLPFSMQPTDKVVYERDGHSYMVYHDPGQPLWLKPGSLDSAAAALWRWNHLLVAVWSSHLDPRDGVFWDISPASLGNITVYPQDFASLPAFYDLLEGGDTGQGHPVNPATGRPYTPQIVPRGDYTRVLAEFWADGPNSLTPPGHWFEIWNYANDHPAMQRRFRGQGSVLDRLAWDVKSYFALGGAMHDVAIAAWGVKGWYDTSRPITAIRGMASLGQSSDPSLPGYHPLGLPLLPGYCELIGPGDPLAGPAGEHVGKLKLRAWLGNVRITNPRNQTAGVGWVLATAWEPYQRPSFVSPPFAGYVSGHSTYSRAAAEVLTAFTGNPYFPGGMGEFSCPRNEFLVFEDGPSVDLRLQWATYRDAADQCSLSRIWGSIHPPMDDIAGRWMGTIIGQQALDYAEQYFVKEVQPLPAIAGLRAFPNPTHCWVEIQFPWEGSLQGQVYGRDGRLLRQTELIFADERSLLSLQGLPAGLYYLVGRDAEGKVHFSHEIVRTD